MIVFESISVKVDFNSTNEFFCLFDESTEFDVNLGETIPQGEYPGPHTVAPTEEQQVLHTANLQLAQNVVVDPIPSNYVGSEITRRSSSDVIAAGATVTAPSGYYETSASKTVQAGTATTPATSQTENPSISVDGSGIVTASYSKSFGITPTVEEGYVTSGTEGTVTVSGSASMQLDTESGQTITPTESAQTAVEENVYTLGEITVAAIPSDYVGSDIPKKSSSDLTASGATVSVPSGYYEENSSKSVQSGTEGTPVATKGEVADHSVTVTPTVTNTEGYISGSTKTGTPVTVSASELVSGTKSITANGTGIDVINYQKVDVAVPGSQPNLQTKTKSYTPSETAQSENVTADSGYDGLDEVSVTVGAIPSNYVGSSIPRRDDDDISIFEETDAAVAVASSGYYPYQAQRNIPYVTGQQSVSYNSTTGVITATNTFPSSGYVPSGTAVTATGQVNIAHATLRANGTYYAVDDDNDAWTGVTVNVPAPSPTLQTKSKSYTPTESSQTETVTADNGYDGLSSVGVSVAAIPSNYVGTGIGRRDEDDILFNDGMVGVTSGYYQSNTVKQIPSASIYGGYDAVVTPAITVDASGLITAGILDSQEFAFCYGSGWVNASESTDIRVQGYNTLQLTNGNNLEYGLTDATSSMVGVGKVGSMIIK